MKRLALLLFVTFPLLAEPQRLIVEYAQRPRGLRVAREFTRVFHGAAVEVASEQEAEQLRNTPGVIAVYPDLQVVAHQSVGTAAPGRPRRPRAAGATPAGATQGSGITVAVIDSGIDHTHPALAGKVIGGWDFVNDDAHPMDDFRHGTHVAGIIAAQSAEMTGVAPGVKLLAYKVLNERGNGVSSDVIAAIERALADGADIANLSLGVIGHANDPVARAVENAVAAGMVVTVSAGNDGEFHRVSSPGVAESAITVGAIDG
ncbi:MAG TPA: S8 family serine peptidase, partial [Thermoanaerobaculia bacterium]|nr:S8 family serine peptidase [Thermoanaerobaculia bacterium]